MCSRLSFVIFVLKELDMSYNGVIFLVVADMLTYVEDRKNKLIVFIYCIFMLHGMQLQSCYDVYSIKFF